MQPPLSPVYKQKKSIHLHPLPMENLTTCVDFSIWLLLYCLSGKDRGIEDQRNYYYA